jgi:hypothetical protein
MCMESYEEKDEVLPELQAITVIFTRLGGAH